MTTAIQPRTLKTRARLIEAATAIVEDSSFTELRVEEVVRRAGVAKGTFFAHFKDKDALLDRMIGEIIDQHLDQIGAGAAPTSVDQIMVALTPLMTFIGSEREVFGVILRYSGATTVEEIGPIAATFERFVLVLSDWFIDGPFRQDADPATLAEGVQAFMFQALALNFCAINNQRSVHDRLRPYLELWLHPAKALDPQG
ncbi:transcriptional regulator, TetR family [Aliiroseovarius halocynthiae]|uniref:TetR/AcrR family transcriptional regulator n=1 Tax=Aliiroseovarius halocynthiae TaxID=985055 RepID=A0A545SUB0_9RHOB|nr:TetR/AcrR family transcriptional regulator [Aliiroseovarius halocynthiae]TQV68555.1 TetR/AcrR family transcriptional regulator [Aliiroseovarius halocynthiae]SMR70960.1 transcriptional regulator, TetR family [Aliiroseovarius halocynthiae]